MERRKRTNFDNVDGISAGLFFCETDAGHFYDDDDQTSTDHRLIWHLRFKC